MPQFSVSSVTILLSLYNVYTFLSFLKFIESKLFTNVRTLVYFFGSSISSLKVVPNIVGDAEVGSVTKKDFGPPPLQKCPVFKILYVGLEHAMISHL